MKKISLFATIFVAFFTFGVMNVEAATSFDGMEENGVITLTENVELASKYQIDDDKEITIDLNGYTLTGPTDNYLIDNRGTIKIIDNGSSKGKISCPSSASSCLRNLGEMTIDGVTVESAFAAVKNDAENNYYGNLIVKNATLISTRTGSTSVGFTGVLQNWGSAIVDNTTITATENEYAVFARSGSATNTDSTITISNSTLTGSYFVVQERDGSNQTTQTVNISNSTLNGQAKGNKSSGAISSYSGDITVTTNKVSVNNVVVANSKPGTKITFDMDYNTTLAIPEGVTVIIPEGRVLTVKTNGVKVGDGKLEVQGEMEGAGAYLENANAYYPTLQNAIRYGVSSKGTDTIKLLSNTKETSKIDVNSNKNITIDLNGYTVDGTNSVVIANNGTLTFMDTSKDKTGEFNPTITNNGSLTIEGGTFANAPVTNDGATTTLNGGTYPIEDIENVVIPEDKEIIKNEDGSYSIVPINEEIEVTDPEPTTPETPVEEVKEEAKNPETSDGILLFLGLTVVGITGSVLTYRRLHN